MFSNFLLFYENRGGEGGGGSHFTDRNQLSSSVRSGSITPIYYANLDRRIGDGRRLRFAIIVDGIIDAHLSRYVADNRRAT